MFSDFLTPTQLSNEEMYLNNLACPQMPEPAGCTVGVLTWWRQIAPLIFSEDATYKICKSLNSECSSTTRHVLITNFQFYCNYRIEKLQESMYLIFLHLQKRGKKK